MRDCDTCQRHKAAVEASRELLEQHERLGIRCHRDFREADHLDAMRLARLAREGFDKHLDVHRSDPVHDEAERLRFHEWLDTCELLP